VEVFSFSTFIIHMTPMNTFRVGLLLVALTALFVLIGNWLGGSTGMVIALVLALAMNLGSYWFSDKIVLRMTGAQPVAREQAPGLYAMTERLAQRAGIPMPRLYVVPDPSPNAFATGRNPQHGVVAVNQGLLNMLNEREVEGVIAHELGHIKHRDTLTMAVVAALAGAIMTLLNIAQWSMIFGLGSSDDEEGANPLTFLVLMLVAPLAATLIQMGISRAREFEADRIAAELAGTPEGLISALRKLERGVELVPATTARPATAHMNIVNPLAGIGGAMMGLFMTHPPIEKRIERLRDLAGESRFATTRTRT
jgi:heat shock protein HtpX